MDVGSASPFAQAVDLVGRVPPWPLIGLTSANDDRVGTDWGVEDDHTTSFDLLAREAKNSVEFAEGGCGEGELTIRVEGPHILDDLLERGEVIVSDLEFSFIDLHGLPVRRRSIDYLQ